MAMAKMQKMKKTTVKIKKPKKVSEKSLVKKTNKKGMMSNY